MFNVTFIAHSIFRKSKVHFCSTGGALSTQDPFTTVKLSWILNKLFILTKEPQTFFSHIQELGKWLSFCKIYLFISSLIKKLLGNLWGKIVAAAVAAATVLAWENHSLHYTEMALNYNFCINSCGSICGHLMRKKYAECLSSI